MEWNGERKDDAEPVKNRVEELAGCIAEIELALQVADRESLGTKLTELVASKRRESIVPDNLLGYHLLAGSQLTATERSTILSSTSIGNNSLSTLSTSIPAPAIGLASIENGLLLSWQDRELVERDNRESKKPHKGPDKRNMF